MLLLERLSPDERAASRRRWAPTPVSHGCWTARSPRWVPCLDAHGHPALRVVTQAAALAAANRAVGRRAVAALLARLFRGAARACPAVHG
ncbi:hypothetical protein [Burkholderia glumae]|uniref:hypothetical protein n=1 Tax=Burkholderia glumae TaxID=337 RepID=UPI0005C29634|nr:hypothetical protein [Burkholderia glumae]MCM2493994.1 hypothetical protein [Burkholderia glumae]MCM2544942.1 hypothetical protein [Burkholderia glumae]MCM2550757.1 hypothetical protein [Burkholderia glumae]NVE24180.1 hypothetical protein [Burkholderia glumae]QGA40304.1 hypothetical protein GAS19_22440 [Burkholderia glumae]